MPRSKSKSKPPTQRQLRVGEVLRQAVAETLARGDIFHPVLETNSVTVSEVRIGPDLKHAKVYVMPLGGSDTDAVLEALTEQEMNIRHQMAKKVFLRFVPRLRFVLDTSYDTASRVESLLRGVKATEQETDSND